MMVVHVDPEQKTGFLVSFPRDLSVQRSPASAASKINAAFNGGPQQSSTTIKQNFDIPISHYLEVDFEASRASSTRSATSPSTSRRRRETRTAGSSHPSPRRLLCTLDGNQALEYVRSRHLRVLHSTGSGRRTRPCRPRPHRSPAALHPRARDRAFSRVGEHRSTALDIADATIAEAQGRRELSSDDIFELINTFRNVDPNDRTRSRCRRFPVQRGPPAHASGSILQAKQPDADAVLARLARRSAPAPERAERTERRPRSGCGAERLGSGRCARGRRWPSSSSRASSTCGVGNQSPT